MKLIIILTQRVILVSDFHITDNNTVARYLQILHHRGLKKERKSAFKCLVIVRKTKHVTTTDI